MRRLFQSLPTPVDCEKQIEHRGRSRRVEITVERELITVVHTRGPEGQESETGVADCCELCGQPIPEPQAALPTAEISPPPELQPGSPVQTLLPPNSKDEVM